MLPHAGPRTRTWHEVVALGAELESLRAVAGARTEADVAIVLDWSSWWALELDSRPSTLLSMVAILRSWYEPLWRRGYSIDFAHPESDLSGYALVLVPQLYSVTDRGAARIVEAAERGSSVAVGYFSGAVDERDRVRTGGYPAPWQELLGIWVEEYRPLLPGDGAAIRSTDPSLPDAAVATGWSEHLHLTTAEAVMSYSGGDIDGLPAVTRRDHPSGGIAWYVSAGLERGAMDALVGRIAADSAAHPILPTPPPAGIEVAVRETDEERYLFLLNHGSDDQAVEVSSAEGSAWKHATSRAPAGGTVTVAGGDVVVLVERRERTPDS
jgi:beta-galactosidase